MSSSLVTTCAACSSAACCSSRRRFSASRRAVCSAEPISCSTVSTRNCSLGRERAARATTRTVARRPSIVDLDRRRARSTRRSSSRATRTIPSGSCSVAHAARDLARSPARARARRSAPTPSAAARARAPPPQAIACSSASSCARERALRVGRRDRRARRSRAPRRSSGSSSRSRRPPARDEARLTSGELATSKTRDRGGVEDGARDPRRLAAQVELELGPPVRRRTVELAVDAGRPLAALVDERPRRRTRPRGAT